MPKVYITRKKINEDVAITDPTLAQQYLAVKKQMSDKRTKRDQLMKGINQIDSELNILDKNLLAIETKSAQQTGAVKVQPENQRTEPTQPTDSGGEVAESLDEDLSNILAPKAEDELPTFEDYRELVIEKIDEIMADGESLAFDYNDLLHRYYNKQMTPEFVAEVIQEIESGFDDYRAGYDSDLEFEAEGKNELDDSYIGGDSMGKMAAGRATPIPTTIMKEGIDYKEDMVINVNGKRKYIKEVEEYPEFKIVHYDDKMISSKWLDNQQVEVIQEPDLRSDDEIEECSYKIREEIFQLENELRELQSNHNELRLEMEEDLADYEETTYMPEKNPRYSLDSKKIESPQMPHDYWGEVLQKNEDKMEAATQQLRKLYDDPDCPWVNKYKDSEITYDEDVKRSQMHESFYDDLIDDIETERDKLDKIQDFIVQTTQNIEIDINLPDGAESKIPDEEPEILEPEPEILEPILVPEEPPVSEPPPSQETPAFDLVHYEEEPSGSKDIPFKLTPEEDLTNETIKSEDKEPYTPELVEAGDVETELAMLNYEDDDQPQDEYVFHIRIDNEVDPVIVAKIFRDSEDDFWTVRVVKGDEGPLQSMEFDPRLNKLDIIGYIAEFYNDVEILDKKEYEYMLDDKEEVDAEYYADLK